MPNGCSARRTTSPVASFVLGRHETMRCREVFGDDAGDVDGKRVVRGPLGAVGVERHHRVVVALRVEVEAVFEARLVGTVDRAERQAEVLLLTRQQDVAIDAVADRLGVDAPHETHRLRSRRLRELRERTRASTLASAGVGATSHVRYGLDDRRRAVGPRRLAHLIDVLARRIDSPYERTQRR